MTVCDSCSISEPLLCIQFLVSASYDDTIRVWNEQDEEWGPACTLTGHTSTVWSIAFDKMGEYMGAYAQR